MSTNQRVEGHHIVFGFFREIFCFIDMYSGLQWASALSCEKTDSVITHLLKAMAINGHSDTNWK